MYLLLGLVGCIGAIASLIFIIRKASKRQPKKMYVIALVVCCVLCAIALIVKPSSDSNVPASMASGTPASAAPSAPAATAEPILPTDAPAQTPAATPAPVEATASIPTEAPTAEPAPTLAPVSDEQLDEGYLDAWFDDSVMVGDSIAGGLNMYVTNERGNDRPCLGSMRIVGVSGLTLQNAIAGESKDKPGQVLFRSRFMTISEVVEITQAKRLFLMLGVRDLEWYSPERLIDIYGKLIVRIKTDHPDLKIYIHSIMPTIKFYAESAGLNYKTNKATNEMLRTFCEENGYTYIELADLVRDEDGFLKYEYSGSDYSFHPNDIAKAIWVRLLRSCARDEYYAGIWKPGEKEND